MKPALFSSCNELANIFHIFVTLIADYCKASYTQYILGIIGIIGLTCACVVIIIIITAVLKCCKYGE